QVALLPLGAIATSVTFGRGGDVLLQAMTKQLEELGGRILLGHRATSLVLDGTRVTGVGVQGPSGIATILAGGIVLGDGGFQADPELVERHIGLVPGRYVQRGAGTGCGTALRLATEAGAQLVHLDSFYGHLLSRDALSNDRLWPYPNLDALV